MLIPSQAKLKEFIVMDRVRVTNGFQFGPGGRLHHCLLQKLSFLVRLIAKDSPQADRQVVVEVEPKEGID